MLTCWEVVKTCERGAAEVKVRLSRQMMVALKGKKPRKVPGSQLGNGGWVYLEVG